MLPSLGAAQSLVVTVAGRSRGRGLGLVDAARMRPDAYPAAGKRTKNFWVILLAVATLIGFVSSFPLGMLGIIAFVGAAVYLADVRPALRHVSGGGGWGRRP